MVAMCALTPITTYCAEGKSDEKVSTPNSFDQFLKSANTISGPKFDSFDNILAKAFEKGGGLTPVKDLFESGLPGQVSTKDYIHINFNFNFFFKVGYGFLMGYSSGYCIKKVKWS